MCVDRVTAFIQIRTVAPTLYIETPLVRSRSGDGERVSKGRETLQLWWQRRDEGLKSQETT